MRKSLFLVALGCCAVLCGCGESPRFGGGSPPVQAYPTLTGNWALGAYAQATGDETMLGGYITNTNGSVSGILHFIDSPCFPLTEDVPISGTVSMWTADTPAAISVSSSPVAGQTFSFTGTVGEDQDLQGTYSIAGGCANGGEGAIYGGIVPPFTSTYSGTFVSGSTSIGVSMTTSQTGPNSDGVYQVGGPVTFTGSPCFSSGTVTSSVVVGVYIEVTITASNGGVVEFEGQITSGPGLYPPFSETISGKYQVVAGSCAGNSGTGSLSGG